MTMRNLVIALLAVFLIAGCGAPAAAPANAPASAPAAEGAQTIDVTSLGRDVDVQTAAALREQPDVVILDVREQSEWDEGHIPGAVFMPMGEVSSRLSEIPTDKTVIVQCRSGNRSNRPQYVGRHQRLAERGPAGRAIKVPVRQNEERARATVPRACDRSRTAIRDPGVERLGSPGQGRGRRRSWGFESPVSPAPPAPCVRSAARRAP
jgi:phage shock protein E